MSTCEWELAAPCLFGLESLVARQVRSLGYETTEVTDGRVMFRGGPEAVARANLWLRCAERVLIRLGKFRAESFDALFEGVRALPWEQFLPADAAFPVTGHALKSQLHSVPDCQRIVKKAIVERLRAVYHRDWFPETGIRAAVQFLILKDEASLLLDTTGEGLHKRGYRENALEAPLRETLAAALVELSRWRSGWEFLDPFCGSGTIAIEAALYGYNLAPGLRRRFTAEDWQGMTLPEGLFAAAREEALSLRRDVTFTVRASDLDPRAVALTEKNARLAGVGGAVRAAQADARRLSLGQERGVLIANPPYGERLLEAAEAERLCRDFGAALRNGNNWSWYILSFRKDFEDFFGHRAVKRRKLYNGMKQCELFAYV